MSDASVFCSSHSLGVWWGQPQLTETAAEFAYETIEAQGCYRIVSTHHPCKNKNSDLWAPSFPLSRSLRRIFFSFTTLFLNVRLLVLGTLASSCHLIILEPKTRVTTRKEVISSDFLVYWQRLRCPSPCVSLWGALSALFSMASLLEASCPFNLSKASKAVDVTVYSKSSHTF